jgi:hypothetical protein
VIETELQRLDEDLFPEVGSGGGGNGWTSDDPGEGWGWSEDPDDGDGPPYRRSRVMRAVAVATVAAVVLGSIGTWVVFLAVGSPQASFAVSSVGTTLTESGDGGTGQHVNVRFEVANQSNTGAPVTCRATVATATSTVGSAEVRLPRLAGGQWDRVSVGVPVDPSALVGHGLASARVTCLPAASG